jgi:protoporphyrinogen oxidase
VRSLPPWLLAKSFFDYLAVRLRNAVRPIPDDNFENWVIKRFGRTLYDLFFGTYTRKAWGIPCTQISADWASQRISLLSLWDTVKKTLFKPRNVPRTYVSRFLYPKTGGIGELSRGYRRLIVQGGGQVITDAEVVRLNSEDNRVTSVVYRQGGREHEVASDLFVSTIPLTMLVPMLGERVPANVREAVAGLKHKGIVFVYLKLDRPQLTPDHWIYIPEQHIAVHRISEFTNFSRDTAPRGPHARLRRDHEHERRQALDHEGRGPHPPGGRQPDHARPARARRGAAGRLGAAASTTPTRSTT